MKQLLINPHAIQIRGKGRHLSADESVILYAGYDIFLKGVSGAFETQLETDVQNADRIVMYANHDHIEAVFALALSFKGKGKEVILAACDHILSTCITFSEKEKISLHSCACQGESLFTRLFEGGSL